MLYFTIWQFDAGIRPIARRLRDDLRGQPANSVSVSATWYMTPALEFYREIYKIGALKPIQRNDPTVLDGFDYYVLNGDDRGNKAAGFLESSRCCFQTISLPASCSPDEAERPVWILLSAAVIAARLCHLHILWADEDYHLAAAIQVLAGKLPYRDFWYDKPPLNLLFYLLFGAHTGVPLRLADSAFVILCSALAFAFASSLWSRREGYFAAAISCAFFHFLPRPRVSFPRSPIL